MEQQQTTITISTFFPYPLYYVFISELFLISCLGHVVNLRNVDVMTHITKIAVIKNAAAIWEYNPVRGHPVSHDNRPRIETFQSAHPCSDDAIVTSHNRPHIKISRSAPFCRDDGVVTSHNRPHIETFQSAGPYIPPHHRPTFASQVRPRIEIFQSAGPHIPS